MVLEAYAAYSLKEPDRMSSSSGGVFSLLAEQLLKMNGVVYGVAMSDDCKSAHFLRVTNIDQLGDLHGSKYFQAHMGDTFKRIKADLEEQVRYWLSGSWIEVISG